MVEALNFSLVLNVRESAIVNSLLSLVCDSVKKVGEMVGKLNFLEIKLMQGTDDNIRAEVSVENNNEVYTETCTSPMWDIAFLNALDKIQERSRNLPEPATV